MIVSMSGGKDSLASILALLEAGCPPALIQLWHQDVDGHGQQFMDWPSTPGYCRAIARTLGLPIFFQYRIGGFLAEMLKEEERSRPVRFQLQGGGWGQAGGLKGKIATRRRFPQPTSNLMVRWCSASLKIDVAALALNNDPALRNARILFVTGERRQESPARSRYAQAELHRCNSSRRGVHAYRPVIDWSEGQVWDIIERHRIRPHPAYFCGWGRLSCAACIFGRPDQWASLRAIAPEMFDTIAALEMELGSTVHHGSTVNQLADRGVPYPAIAHYPEQVALALGEDYPARLARLAEGEEWTVPAGAHSSCGGPS